MSSTLYGGFSFKPSLATPDRNEENSKLINEKVKTNPTVLLCALAA